MHDNRKRECSVKFALMMESHVNCVWWQVLQLPQYSVNIHADQWPEEIETPALPTYSPVGRGPQMVCVCVDGMNLKCALHWHIHISVHSVLCQCIHAHTHTHARTHLHTIWGQQKLTGLKLLWSCEKWLWLNKTALRVQAHIVVHWKYQRSVI